MRDNTTVNSRITLNLFVASLCLTAAIIIFFNQNYKGYELLFTQPIIYSLVFVLIFSKIITEDKTRLFFIVLASISGIRYVTLPFFVTVSGYYGGRSLVEPSSTSFNTAILLMNYELIVVAITIKISEVLKNSKTSIQGNIQEFKANTPGLGYVIFFIFTLFGILLYPSTLSNLNFISPSVTVENIEISGVENIISYCITVSKQLIYIMLIKRLYLKFQINKRSSVIFLAFLVSLINISIYFGTNRSDIVISAIVSFLVLYKLFGRKTIKYFFIGGIILLLLVSVVSKSREISGISRGANRFLDITDTLQVYTGGVYNVAIALETKVYFPDVRKISVLFFDIFRPMIGVGVFLKNLPFEYSNIFFNRRMWLNIDRRSQILPMIGQGNIFFGYLLSPIFSIIFVRIYYILERKINKTVNLEVYYFVALVVVRLGFFMGQNTMNMINDMSMNLVLFSIVFYFNKIVNKKVLDLK